MQNSMPTIRIKHLSVFYELNDQPKVFRIISSNDIK